MSTGTKDITSSRRTDGSTYSEDVVALGGKLVEELGSASDVDMLTRWMAHFIAEQILKVEESTGRTKAQAEQVCFDAVLRLWAHRSNLPGGTRPFESFEPIFKTLQSLELDKGFRYLRGTRQKNKRKNKIDQWLELAEATDEAARSLIRFFVDAASAEAARREKDWTKVGLRLAEDEDKDLRALQDIVLNIDFGRSDIQEKIEDIRRKKLMELKVKLDTFSKLCRDTSKEIQTAIKPKKRTAKKKKRP